jgi:hypothetical protein
VRWWRRGKGVMGKANVMDILVQRCLADIDVLIASPSVHQFIVGYTSNLEKRRRDYMRVGIPHVYAIATLLEFELALEVEKRLFFGCMEDKRALRYKKYHAEKRDKSYSPSSGGKNAQGIPCAVYVACFSA